MWWNLWAMKISHLNLCVVCNSRCLSLSLFFHKQLLERLSLRENKIKELPAVIGNFKWLCLTKRKVSWVWWIINCTVQKAYISIHNFFGKSLRSRLVVIKESTGRLISLIMVCFFAGQLVHLLTLDVSHNNITSLPRG